MSIFGPRGGGGGGGGSVFGGNRLGGGGGGGGGNFGGGRGGGGGGGGKGGRGGGGGGRGGGNRDCRFGAQCTNHNCTFNHPNQQVANAFQGGACDGSGGGNAFGSGGGRGKGGGKGGGRGGGDDAATVQKDMMEAYNGGVWPFSVYDPGGSEGAGNLAPEVMSDISFEEWRWESYKAQQQGRRSMVKVPSWLRHSWPPRASQAASGGLRLLYAPRRRGLLPWIPPRGRGLGATPHQRRRFRCV